MIEKYEEKPVPFVAIIGYDKVERITLNNYFIKKHKLKKGMKVDLFYDKETEEVGMSFGKEGRLTLYKSSPTGNNLSVYLAGFLTKFNLRKKGIKKRYYSIRKSKGVVFFKLSD